MSKAKIQTSNEGKNYHLSMFSGNSRQRRSGQSLFEVIVALGIAGLVLVAAISLSTATVRNSSFARNDSIATKYAQEGTEWLRQQRDTDWTTFDNQAPGTRCIPNPPPNPPAWSGSGICSIGTPFSRGAILTQVSSNEIGAVVVVQWTDGQGTHEVRNATTFTKWR